MPVAAGTGPGSGVVWVMVLRASAKAWSKASAVRALAECRNSLHLNQAFSMGFKSGEQGGRLEQLRAARHDQPTYAGYLVRTQIVQHQSHRRGATWRIAPAPHSREGSSLLPHRLTESGCANRPKSPVNKAIPGFCVPETALSCLPEPLG